MIQSGSAKTYWDKQDPLFRIIYREGMREYLKTVKSIGKSFELKDRTVRCIDEGVRGGVHIAGSGILLDLSMAAAFIKAANADGILVHEECGAAAEAYRRLPESERAKYSGADEYAARRAQQLAKAAGIPYKGVICFENGAERMHRPRGLHIARIVYYDGTGIFNPSEGLPPGFVVSRRYEDADCAIGEAAFTAKIATGAHGFGELITEDAPYIIAVIGDPRNPVFSLGRLKKEVKLIASEHGERVRVDGFTAPI